MTASSQGRTVPCPSCKQPAPFTPANPWRPFCSERCRQLDLGAWASERFRVPGEGVDDFQAPPDPRRDDVH